MYKIYAKGNYIVVVDTKNEYFYGHKKEVFIDKNNIDKSNYRIFNVKDLKDGTVVSIPNILKEDGTPYTEAEFDTFYRENTGNFNGGGTAPTQGVIEITRAEAVALQASSSFVPGTTYVITDADTPLYGGTEITLTAITPSELSLRGSGKFYCPKYDLSAPSTGYGMFNTYMEGEITNVVGELLVHETVSDQNGATAIYLAPGLLQWLDGDWSLATNIFGASGAADVSGFTSPSYNVDDLAHWGGKTWKNLYGQVGTPDSKYLLDYNWEEVPFNETDYNVFVDEIEYDFFSDMIIYRKDKFNNLVSGSTEVFYHLTNLYGNPIKDFQWGCALDSTNQYKTHLTHGILGNSAINSYIGTLNTVAKSIICNELSDLSYYVGNDVFTDSYVSYNKVSIKSQINSNILYKNSFIEKNIIELFSFFQNQFLSNGSYVSNNRLSSLSVFTTNNLINGSYIEKNTLDTQSLISNTKTTEGNFISNISLSGSVITDNEMDSFSFMYNNSLKSNSQISTNSLGVNSGIEFNTFVNGTKLINNTIPDNKLVNNNTASNSFLKFSNITENITAVAANNFNITNATIDLTGSTILQTTYGKTLFTNSADVNRLQYVNSSDVIVITDVDA